MHLALLFLMFASPFWQEKPAADWSDLELSEIFADSPWAQRIDVPARSPVPAPSIQVYLATAAPMTEAEKERARRLEIRRKGAPEPEDPLAEEYRAWLEDNHATQVVIAIRMAANNPKLSEASEVKHLEEDSFMQIGKKKYMMTGHFPPTIRDPYLRMAFPRQMLGDEKTVTFALYVLGLPLPFREAQFKVKDMVVNGKVEW